MEEPQSCRSNDQTIMIELGSLLGLFCHLGIFHQPLGHPALDVLSHHLRVITQMALGGEESFVDVYSLDRSGLGPSPDMRFLVKTREL